MAGKPFVLVITGATATGKSALAMQIAERYPSEIISADSAQVYKGMDIGTAKPSREDMERVRHHLVDIIEPQERFNVRQFCRLADDAIRMIVRRGRLPIVVGGTGLYVRALTEGYRFNDAEPRPELRRYYQKRYEANGIDWLRNEWNRVAASMQQPPKVDLNNPRRIIRALEIALSGDQSEIHSKTSPVRPYNDIKFVLQLPRPDLRQAVQRRLVVQMKQGFIQEVIALLERGVNPSAPGLQTLGYREIVQYLQEQYPYRTLMELLVRNTRRFAKRQETWFRKEPNARVLPAENPQFALNTLIQTIEIEMEAGREDNN